MGPAYKILDRDDVFFPVDGVLEFASKADASRRSTRTRAARNTQHAARSTQHAARNAARSTQHAARSAAFMRTHARALIGSHRCRRSRFRSPSPIRFPH